MDDSDRRKYPRFDVELPLKNFCHSSAGEISASTRDISSKGIGCVCGNGLPVGTPLDVWIYVPGKEPQLVEGIVVWRCNDGGLFRMGIELTTQELKPIPMVLNAIRNKCRSHH